MTSPRRTFLRRSAAALLAGATAGCLSGDTGTATDEPPGASTDDATETATATPTETHAPTATATPTPSGPPNADYAAWLPAPAALDRDHYAFTSAAPAALVDRASDLGDGAVETFRGGSGVPGVESYADTASFVQLGLGVLVFDGGVDRGAAAEGLRSQGYSETETAHGFAVFAQEGGGAAALGESALVTAPAFNDRDRATATVEAILAARTGDGERYVDASADCARLVDALGSGHILAGRTYRAGATFDGAVAGGIAYEVAGSETAVRTPAVFREGQVDEAAVADWAADAEAFYGREPETAVDGRVVTARATVDSADIERFRQGMPGESPRGGTRTPQVAFTFEYEPAGDGVGRLTITHEGGDSVPEAELFVRGAGFADVEGVDQTAAGGWQGTASGDDATVVAGDSVTVGVAGDYEISVVWEPEDRDTSATLADGEGPDA
ncbi:hypothetical protein [Halosimplex halobium]|uniref:hypothetical protein n=1 Tax=Halosimplex halobium TaxID=3396618 RepID=UPI003F578EFA